MRNNINSDKVCEHVSWNILHFIWMKVNGGSELPVAYVTFIDEIQVRELWFQADVFLGLLVFDF